MLDRLIFFSIHNKLIVAIFTLALVIWGGYSLKHLPIDAVPDITNNQVQILTVSPSLAAQEIERLVTFPIEQMMATIPQTVEVRSFSHFGLSGVTIVFEDDVDIYWARQQISERLAVAQTQIPASVGVPEMAPVSTGLGEIYQYTVFAKPGFEQQYDAQGLRTIQDWIIRRQLLGIQGVADISSFGGFVKQYEISLDPDKLRSYNLSIADIFDALSKNNQNTGGAYIDKKPSAYFIRSEGMIKSLQDIALIRVTSTQAGTPILIRDIGEVRFGNANRYGALTRNAEGEAVGGIVFMLKGENSNEVIDLVKDRITEIRKSLPEGVDIDVFLDRSHLVDRAINTVKTNLLEGALIVIFVLILFLGNWRAGLIVASAIPLAMLFAVSLMRVFGVSGNLMSLGAIDFGLIIDGSVIIVEATLHHLHSSNIKRFTQAQMDEEVYFSAKKIRSSAAFGEIIILIVYLPILALVGVEGKMFRPMAQTISFAILGAFILSLTYIPMMSAAFLSKNVSHKVNISDRMMDFFQRLYMPVIRMALKFKMAVIGAALSILVAAMCVFMSLGGEFIPTLEEGDFAVETRLMGGSSLSQTIEKTLLASDILLKKFPEVKQVIGKIGSSEIPTDPMPIEACDLMIILKEKDEWTSATTRDELAEKMGKELEALVGINFSFQQPIQMRFNELMSGVKQDVGIKIYGEDLDELTRLAQHVGKITGGINGVKDLYIEELTGLPQIVITPDRNAMSRFGIDVETINQTITTAFAGQATGQVLEGEKRFDLVVRLQEHHRQNIEDVQNLFVTTPSGNQVPLRQLAEVAIKLGPKQIQRENAGRRIVVGFNVRGRDVASLVKEVQQRIDAEMKMPPGYYIRYGGQFKNLEEAQARLAVAVPVALSLIFILLYFTFGSFKQSALIFTAIPMAAIGGVFALMLRGMPFSVSAGVGFIALFGVAVLNGIVLVGEFNRLKKDEGMFNLHRIILKGTQVRLRPVLMTAAVASLGFLPMALSNSSGAEVQKPLATVVIGGLLTSTLLTLLVLPVLYWFFERGGKPSNTGTKAMLVLAALCYVLPSQAQEVKYLTEEEAVALALKQNKNMQALQYSVEAQQHLQKTAVELNPLSLSSTIGQYNSFSKKDNNFTVSQTIPFPALFKAKAKMLQANTDMAVQDQDLGKMQLSHQVRMIWNDLAYLHSLGEWYSMQDSLLTEFARVAAVKHQSGESNLLEKASAENALNQLRAERRLHEAKIMSSRTSLQSLLLETQNVNIQYKGFSEKTADYPALNLDSAALAQHPALAKFQAQARMYQGQAAIDKAQMLPTVTLGYFNQTLIGAVYPHDPGRFATGSKRFYGFQVGVGIPIWQKPHRARIEASKQQEQATQSQYEQSLTEWYAQIQQLDQEIRQLRENASYYKNQGLAQANLLVEQAQKAYKAGEASYVEYLQALQAAAEIRNSQRQTIYRLNQAVLSAKFLLGGA